MNAVGSLCTEVARSGVDGVRRRAAGGLWVALLPAILAWAEIAGPVYANNGYPDRLDSTRSRKVIKLLAKSQAMMVLAGTR